MNVLSLFDGMSGAQLALEYAGIKVDNYYSFEIDKYARAVTQFQFPKTIQLGDIKNWRNALNELRRSGLFPFKIDLLIGGSPCQGFSHAGKGLSFDDPRSKLFLEFVDILTAMRPKYFILENVRMKKEWVDVITSFMGVEPILINSALVSAQNRNRLYWTNIPVEQPEDKGILLKDILLPDADEPSLSNIYGGFKETEPRVHYGKSPTLRPSTGGGHVASVIDKKKVDELILSKKAINYMSRKVTDGRTHFDFKHHSDIRNDKSACVTSNFYKGVPYNVLVEEKLIRKFHPIECERLQTVTDNYTKTGYFGMFKGMKPISNTQRYKMLGNGFTVSVIAHILKEIKNG